MGDFSRITRFRVASFDCPHSESEGAQIDELKVESEEDGGKREPDEDEGNWDTGNRDSVEDDVRDGLGWAGHQFIDSFIDRHLCWWLRNWCRFLAEGDIALRDDEKEGRKEEKEATIHENRVQTRVW